MKPNSSFKMKQEVKRVAATILDKHKRSEYKKRAIEAQLYEEQAKRQSLKVKDKE